MFSAYMLNIPSLQKAWKSLIKIKILIPKNKKKGDRPCVLWIHGGGYKSGNSNAVYFSRAIPLVKKYNTVLDLYCGVGTLGLSLKDNFTNIYGIEKVKNAIEEAIK